MMKLYSKNLPDLHALKKEKARLQKELNGTENKGEKASSDQQKERIASELLSGITSGSLLTSALHAAPVVMDILKRSSLFSKKDTPQKIASVNKKESIASKAIKEFAGGYIKWKMLELAYKGIKKVLKSATVKDLKKKKVPSLKKLFKK